MKKIIILHWRDSRDKSWEWEKPQNVRHWLWWLKEECKKLWYEAYNPLIPRDWEATYEHWKIEIEKFSDNIDENTTLIWTSAGWAFWLRWLWENEKIVDKLILIAPARYPSDNNKKEMKNHFYTFDVDGTIPNRVQGWITILISNDEERHIRAWREYAELLWADLIELKDRGHFTVEHSRKNSKIPEVLELI